MKRYQRLKSIDGSGTIMRYYELADNEEAYTNAFYKIASNKATKIEGKVSGADYIGFSHGGNALVDGMILLDINDQILYLCELDDADEKPNIGELVNGYLRVIDTHYDDDNASGKGTLPEEWGIETLDNPYFIAKIEQPTATSTATISDTDCGTLTPHQKKKSSGGGGGGTTHTVTFLNVDPTYSGDLSALATDFNLESNRLPVDEQYTLQLEIEDGQTLASKYVSIVIMFDDGKRYVAPITNPITADTVIEVSTADAGWSLSVKNVDLSQSCTVTATIAGTSETEYTTLEPNGDTFGLMIPVKNGEMASTAYSSIVAVFGETQVSVDVSTVITGDTAFEVSIPNPQISSSIRLINNSTTTAFEYTATQLGDPATVESGTVQANGDMAVLNLTIDDGDAVSTAYSSITVTYTGGSPESLDLTKTASGQTFIDYELNDTEQIPGGGGSSTPIGG